ncbi:MAG: sigma-70 RNA polymerase sigma factor region 4 domain-containing protein [Dehalococcoidia bacterium]
MSSLPAQEVCRRCREETARYRRGEVHDDRYCFDTFRRAIVDRADICWEALLDIFAERVEAWCRIARKDPHCDVEELVAVTWQRFLHAFTPERLAKADGTKSVLKYLKLCAWSVVADAGRAETWELSLDREIGDADGTPITLGQRLADPGPLPYETVADADAAAELWRLINGCLKNEAERELMRLTLELGLKSREIQAQRPDLFRTTDDVYKMTRNVSDRLRRSPELRIWLDSNRG